MLASNGCVSGVCISDQLSDVAEFAAAAKSAHADYVTADTAEARKSQPRARKSKSTVVGETVVGVAAMLAGEAMSDEPGGEVILDAFWTGRRRACWWAKSCEE